MSQIRWQRIVLLVAAFSSAALLACNTPSAEEQDKDWLNAEDLVRTSDRIIIGNLMEEQFVAVQEIDALTGALTDERDVLFRQFEIVEVFKGAPREDSMWVSFEPELLSPLLTADSRRYEFVTGRDYGLFLKGRRRPEQYPGGFGAVLWSGNGQPSVAELNDQDFTFLATRGYLALMERNDLQPVSSLSSSPFALSVSEVESLLD